MIKASILFLIVTLSVPLMLLAEGVPFSETSDPVTAKSGSQTSLITELKYRAVQNWLKNYLGSRYTQFEKQVTIEFSEKYILDYKVSRSSNNKAQVELQGHLDADQLKAWIRVMDARSRGNTAISPSIILSSTVPGVSFSSAETLNRLRDSSLLQSLYSVVLSHIQKFNIHPVSCDLSGLSYNKPPTSETDILRFQEQAKCGTANSALWFNLSQCRNCNGFTLEVYFYSFNVSKVLLARSDDISLPASDYGNPAKTKVAFKPAGTQLAQDFDALIGSGVLQSRSYAVTIEGIDSYQAYKAIDSGLDNLDYVTQVSLKAARNNNTIYEVFSPLTPEEIAAKINAQSFNGFSLKTVRVDSTALVMRYLKGS